MHHDEMIQSKVQQTPFTSSLNISHPLELYLTVYRLIYSSSGVFNWVVFNVQNPIWQFQITPLNYGTELDDTALTSVKRALAEKMQLHTELCKKLHFFFFKIVYKIAP